MAEEIPQLLSKIEVYTQDEHILLCPVCGCDFVHMAGQVVMLTGKDNYEARKAVRGGVILLPAWCEEGHTFQIAIGFHKGHTRFWCERLRDCSPEEHLPDMR